MVEEEGVVFQASKAMFAAAAEERWKPSEELVEAPTPTSEGEDFQAMEFEVEDEEVLEDVEVREVAEVDTVED